MKTKMASEISRKRATKLRGLFNIPHLLLLLLIVIFHTELLTLSIRTYVHFYKNPAAELFLGDYYRSTAKKNNDDANHFYKRSLQQYEDSLKNRVSIKPTFVQPRIAQYYECGKGTKINYDLARKWYEQALRMYEPEWKAKVHAGLIRIHEAKFLASPPTPCPYPSHYQLIGQALNEMLIDVE